MTVHADGSITERRYWRPEYNFDAQRSRQDTVEAIDEAVRDSVRYHNVADVEVGSFLSSGIDSSYMAACLAKRKTPDIKTFTVGFDCYKNAAANNAEGAGGMMRDEISGPRACRDELHIANTNKYIGEDEYWESLPRVQWHMDEPSADPSAVALYFVDQIAATQVKAVLSGEGADEFFGGYRIYQTPFSNAKLSWAPKGLLRGASSVMRKLGIRGANHLERASENARRLVLHQRQWRCLHRGRAPSCCAAAATPHPPSSSPRRYTPRSRTWTRPRACSMSTCTSGWSATSC